MPSPAMFELRLRHLHQMDAGRLEVGFQQHLQRILADLYDRPGLSKARKLIVQFDLIPVPRIQGTVATLERVLVEYQITSKAPAHRSSPPSMEVRRINRGGTEQHQLVFSSMFPELEDSEL